MQKVASIPRNKNSFNKPWIISPSVDLAVFSLTPLLIVPGYQILLKLFTFEILKLAILTVSAAGHHLPGFIRAYTDPSIFARFKYRLIIMPVLILLLAIACASFKLSVIYCVFISWSVWHGCMQVLGFLRIYDAKAGLNSSLTAKLDFWLCLTWFIQIVLWSPPKASSVISSFYLAGGPIIPVSGAKAFEAVWIVLTSLITFLWLTNAAYNYFKFKYWHGAKILTLIMSVGFWAYCMVSINDLIVGLLLWEIFHDLQYNVFVFSYNKRRVQVGLSKSPIEQFLFRPHASRILLYVAGVAAYGSLGLFNTGLLDAYEHKAVFSNWLTQWGHIISASALIHFYIDGFIWKVRDAKVQQDIGVNGFSQIPNTLTLATSSKPPTFYKRSELLHWIWVALFFSSCIALGISEARHRAAAGIGQDNLADLVPESGYANYMRAHFLYQSGFGDSALPYFIKAASIDTNYSAGEAYVGEILLGQKDYLAAIRAFENVLARDTHDSSIELSLSKAYFHQGFELLQLKRGLDAKPFLEKSINFNPQNADAWHYLGMIYQATGNLENAKKHYLRALTLNPNHMAAKDHLQMLEGLPEKAGGN